MTQQIDIKTDIKKRTYIFSLNIIKLIQFLEKNHISRILIDQLLRSATSIGANIIESSAASSKRNFVNYYQIALKSANETKYWLYLLSDSNLVNTTYVAPQIQETTEICKIIAVSLLTMKNKRKF